jgi:hypothetical protein
VNLVRDEGARAGERVGELLGDPDVGTLGRLVRAVVLGIDQIEVERLATDALLR